MTTNTRTVPEDYLNPYSRYSFPEDEDVQERALCALVDAFAGEMKAKLIKKLREGYVAWDNPCFRENIEGKLIEHASRGSGQYVDVANLAAMLWNLDLPIPSEAAQDTAQAEEGKP
jgi:hypothetical protein